MSNKVCWDCNCSQVAQQGNTGGRWIIVLVYVVCGDSHGPTEQRGLTIIFLQEQGPLFIYEDLFIVVCYISVLGNTSESTRERRNAHPKHNHLIPFQRILSTCVLITPQRLRNSPCCEEERKLVCATHKNKKNPLPQRMRTPVDNRRNTGIRESFSYH